MYDVCVYMCVCVCIYIYIYIRYTTSSLFIHLLVDTYFAFISWLLCNSAAMNINVHVFF